MLLIRCGSINGIESYLQGLQLYVKRGGKTRLLMLELACKKRIEFYLKKHDQNQMKLGYRKLKYELVLKQKFGIIAFLRLNL